VGTTSSLSQRHQNCEFASANKPHAETVLGNDAMSPLFLAVIEATEEAIYNSLFRATTVTGDGHTVKALPLDKTLLILREHRAIQ